MWEGAFCELLVPVLGILLVMERSLFPVSETRPREPHQTPPDLQD